MPTQDYDSVLVVSFGGPEKPEDVIPFLENVLWGRNVPRERMHEVADHYYHFAGRSPINDQNRALVAAITNELRQSGPDLPVYWGNRNWHPLLSDTLRTMSADGRKRALAFVTSAYAGYSGCRQYLEDIAGAQAAIGEQAPEVHKLRTFYNHPLFIEVIAERVLAGLSQASISQTALVFTAHSIPVAMAQTSAYEQQLREACSLVADRVRIDNWTLAYQSRSGPPNQPWLGPDIIDTLKALRAQGKTHAVVAPIGFLSDHMEVIYDLDTEARAICEHIGLRMIRTETPGSDPRFARMVGELIRERFGLCPPRAIGQYEASPGFCAPDCCPNPRRQHTAVANKLDSP